MRAIAVRFSTKCRDRSSIRVLSDPFAHLAVKAFDRKGSTEPLPGFSASSAGVLSDLCDLRFCLPSLVKSVERLRMGSLPDYLIRPHHLIVFMLQNVAMPNVAELLSGRDRSPCGQIELGYHPRHVPRIRLHGVLPCRTLVSLRRHRPASRDQLPGLQVRSGIERLAIDHLKLHQMQVNRMHVASCIRKRPDFRRSRFRLFGDATLPLHTTT